MCGNKTLYSLIVVEHNYYSDQWHHHYRHHTVSMYTSLQTPRSRHVPHCIKLNKFISCIPSLLHNGKITRKKPSAQSWMLKSNPYASSTREIVCRAYDQRIATGIEELWRRCNFWLVPFVEIYFINKGINIRSFEMVGAKKIFCQKINENFGFLVCILMLQVFLRNLWNYSYWHDATDV